MVIRIEWLEDSHDCESCGTCYATGARVFFDGKQVIDLEPVAYCFDGDDFDSIEVYSAIIEKLGHTLEESFS